MISLLTRRTSSHFLCPSSPFHHHHHHHQQQFKLLGPLLQQHLSTKPSPLPQNEMPFIARYLVSNFGFSPEQARKSSMSPHLRGTKSPDWPEAVMKFLSDTGLSDTQIMAAVSIAPHLLRCNVDKILIPRVREWIEHGFSEELVVQLIRYCPTALIPFILRVSEEKIKSNMDFLIRKAQLEPKSIISCPHLLGYSVEKRLVPRHHVLSILAAKELNKNCSIISVYLYTEKKFLEKYVEPYKKDVPELAQAYFAASGKHVSV